MYIYIYVERERGRERERDREFIGEISIHFPIYNYLPSIEGWWRKHIHRKPSTFLCCGGFLTPYSMTPVAETWLPHHRGHSWATQRGEILHQNCGIFMGKIWKHQFILDDVPIETSIYTGCSIATCSENATWRSRKLGSWRHHVQWSMYIDIVIHPIILLVHQRRNF